MNQKLVAASSDYNFAPQGEARAAQQEMTGSRKESESLRKELDRTKGMVGTLRSEITNLLSQASTTEEKLTQEVSGR